MAGFEQAVIRIEKEQEFQDLKGAVDRALSSDKAEQFLKRLESGSIRIRDFDAVVVKGVLDRVGAVAGGKKTIDLYNALTVSDRAQLREFYLSRIEEIDAKLRARFQKIYRYY
ncbi:MAG TPA: hypothetical protein VF753_18405 [Terriglobales bacterium]